MAERTDGGAGRQHSVKKRDLTTQRRETSEW